MNPELDRRERKKQANKEAIIQAALELFNQKGFTETTVAEIMTRADLGTGTFYNYFNSKEDLLNSYMYEKISGAKQFMMKAMDESIASKEKLTRILTMVGQTFQENKFFPKLVGQLTRNKPPNYPPVTHGNFFSSLLLKVIQEGQDRGELTNSIPPEVILELTLSLLHCSLPESYTASPHQGLDYKLNLLFEGILK